MKTDEYVDATYAVARRIARGKLHARGSARSITQGIDLLLPSDTGRDFLGKNGLNWTNLPACSIVIPTNVYAVGERLLEWEKLGKKCVEQFRVRCLQPLSHPSVARRRYYSCVVRTNILRSIWRSGKPICRLFLLALHQDVPFASADFRRRGFVDGHALALLMEGSSGR